MQMLLLKLWSGLDRMFFSDPVRPIEWTSLGFLVGWAWFLGIVPEVLGREAYAGFGALPADVWVALMSVVALTQVAAMLPQAERVRGFLRFCAMLLSAGIWAVVAFSFAAAPVPTTGTIGYSVLSCMAGLSAVYLGGLPWGSKSS